MTLKRKKLRSKTMFWLSLAIVFSFLVLGATLIHAINCNTHPCGGTWYYCNFVECGEHPEIYMCCIPHSPI